MVQWLDNEAAALDGRDSEGVHQLRVAIRRLRSAIALFKPWLDAKSATVISLAVFEALSNRWGQPVNLMFLWKNWLSQPWRASQRKLTFEHSTKSLKGQGRKPIKRLREAIGSRPYADLVLDLIFWIEMDRWQSTDLKGSLLEVAPGSVGQTAKSVAQTRKALQTFAGP